MTKLLAVLLLAWGTFQAAVGWTSLGKSLHYRHQLAVMHADAVRGRTYMPKAAWAHEEKQLQVGAARAKNGAIMSFGEAILLAVGASLAWQRSRAIRKRSQDSSLWSSSAPDVPYVPPQPFYMAQRAQSEAQGDDPCAWHEEADAIALIPAQPEDIPSRSSVRYKFWRSGKIGEREAWESIRPLLADGWTLVARNLVLYYEDGTEQQKGDVDLVLVSPNNVLYTIDAKNGYNATVSYEENKASSKIWFRDNWNGGEARDYKVVRAWTLINRTREQIERQLGIRIPKKHVHPIMAFSHVVTMNWERSVWGLHCVRMKNLVLKLRQIDARYEHVNRRELVDESLGSMTSTEDAREILAPASLEDTWELAVIELQDADVDLGEH